MSQVDTLLAAGRQATRPAVIQGPGQFDEGSGLFVVQFFLVVGSSLPQFNQTLFSLSSHSKSLLGL